MKKLAAISAILVFTILYCKAQPNGGFENWSTVLGYQTPDNWQTLNFLSVFSPPNPISAFKVSGVDKHSGNYALKIKTIYVNTNPAAEVIDDTVGVVFTGKINISPPSYKYGFVYTARPEKLEFWAKYIPVAGDTGGARVFLQKWNGIGKDTIAFGEVVIPSTPTYQLFNIDLIYYSTTTVPDSASIVFGSSKSGADARVGSALYVDDVAFTGWVGIDQYDLYTDKINVFPNPAKGELNISVQIDDANGIQVFDALGRSLGVYIIQNAGVILNTSSYSAGAYIFEVHDKKNKILTTGKFNVIN